MGDWASPDAIEGLPETPARLLERLADEDEPPPLPAPLVRLLERPGAPVGAILHAWVRDHVSFTDEAVETFASAATTLRTGRGDCDDSARALVVLARACGIPARFVYLLDGPSPAHVCAQLFESGAWRWAETTIAARYDEHPVNAVDRLGLRRAHLDGLPAILVDGQLTRLRTLHGVTTMTTALPANLGLNFAPALIAQASTIGASPYDVCKILLSESGLNPAARNPSGFDAGTFAAGINQLAPGYNGNPGNWSYFAPMTGEEYCALSAEEQLPYVFAYFRAVMRAAGLSAVSGRDLYWLNYLPATYVAGASDDHVIVPSSSPYYKYNTGLDHGGKGAITAGDMQIAIDNAANASPMWPALQQAIADAGGVASGGMGASLGEAVAVLAGCVLLGGVLAWRSDAILDVVEAVL